MKKRRPKLPEQLGESRDFTWTRLLKGNSTVLGGRGVLKSRVSRCQQHTCRQDGGFAIHLFHFSMLWQLFWRH